MNNAFDDDEKEKKNPNEEEEFSDFKNAFKDMQKEFKKELQDIKKEITDLRETKDPEKYKQPRLRSTRKPRSHTIRIDAGNWDDWSERFGSSMDYYIGGILDSIGDTINRSIGSIFQTSPSTRRFQQRERKRREPYFVPEEELDEFYKKGSSIMGALSDQTRLKMLKELEKRPLRQSDLSLKTDTRGGNFKHHISLLKDEGLVRQEGVRERYLLTFTGREALKLVEFLYSRAKKRTAIPVEITDEEEEEEENENKNLLEEEEE